MIMSKGHGASAWYAALAEAARTAWSADIGAEELHARLTRTLKEDR